MLLYAQPASRIVHLTSDDVIREGDQVLIHQLGIPAQATRVAALRQLVLQAPAPVIADALGYHNKHVARVWTDAGGT